MFSSVLLPLTCIAGMISMAKISLSAISLFVPFLLFGKATSDVVLFLREWERQRKLQSFEYRARSYVSIVGIISVVSAVCGTILCGRRQRNHIESLNKRSEVKFLKLRITNSAREPQESTGYQKIDKI